MGAVRQTAGKTRWLVVAGALLVSALAIVARLRSTPPAAVPVPAHEPPPSPDPRPQPPAPPPTRPIEHPLRRGLIRWLVFVAITAGLVVALLSVERAYATLILAALLVVMGIMAVRRAHLDDRVRRGLESRRARWLVFLGLLVGLALLLPALPRPVSALVLIAGVMIWGGWLLISTGLIGRVQAARLAQQVDLGWLGRWGLFGVVAAALVTLIDGLEYPYSALALAAVIVGVLPLALAQVLPNADNRVALVRGLAVIAVVMAIAGTYAVQPENGTRLTDTWRLLVIGAGALIVAVHQQLRMADAPDIPAPTDQALNPARLSRAHRWLFWVGVALLALLAEANGRILEIPALVAMSVHVQFALLVLGIGLMTMGLGGVRPRWPSIQWRTVEMVAALTGIALFLRFWQIDQTLRLFVDELNFSDVVRHFWDTPNVPLLEPMSGIAAFPFLYPYWQAHGIALFGRNLLGLRAASAVVGALTIPAVYVMGKALFDRKTALIAALLLATFPPHLHFSRLALNNIADPLFGTLGIAFVARGVMTSRRVDYVLGGAMLGLTHYFYEGGRIIFIPIVVVWLAGLLILWGPRLRWRNWLIVGLAALIVALPIYYTLTAIDRPLAARLVNNHTALSGDYWRNLFATGFYDDHIRLRVIHPFLTYIQAPEGSFFYRGDRALILPLLVPLFFLGIGYTLARLRRPGPLILLLLWLATTLGNTLMVEANHAPRYVLIFPTLMVFAAVGVRYTLPMLLPRLRRLQAVLMVVIVAGLAVYQADFYFNHHLIVYNHQMRNDRPHPDAFDAVLRSLNFPPETEIHIISAIRADENFTRGFLRFFNDDLSLYTLALDDLTEDYIANLDPSVDHAFFIEQGREEAVHRLEAHFYLLPPQASPYDDIGTFEQFSLYYAPALAGTTGAADDS